MIKLKFYKVAELEKNQRATVHKSGKLGFTFEAAKRMELESHKSANIGSNELDPNDNNLYLVLYKDEQGDFKVIKAGQYFYINTKILFNNLKLDYIKNAISFEISSQELEGQKIYALKRRIKEKKEKIEDDDLF